ncbi:class B sortase [Desulfosporosinus lacus]|uniref:Sortase B n=1 Tax=Desulfosporosinus lacus DSM 15449 TaxID=1121420 RepID=A0A1M6FMW8_9FIRM|nr:class B sortase [Desulfosporosinus lacus]SHI99020.1 sortase B [Desulfosporosinus lacus DSM 15449]
MVGIKRKLWIIAAVISASLFAVCAGILASSFMEHRALQWEMDALRKAKSTAAMSPCDMPKAFLPEPSSALLPQHPVILPGLKMLYEQNNDMIGWLAIDGTEIDYPVMQTPDNEGYYLDRGFDKNAKKNGLPILDTACDFMWPSDNLIIHGHNMRNGAMFAGLFAYKDEMFCREHPFIRFDTLYRPGNYRIVAVFYSKVYNKTEQVFKYYQFTDAEDQESYNQFIKSIKALSLYDTGSVPEYGDELITLSTCSYHTENGRFVVVAKRDAEDEMR